MTKKTVTTLTCDECKNEIVKGLGKSYIELLHRYISSYGGVSYGRSDSDEQLTHFCNWKCLKSFVDRRQPS